MKIKSLNPSSSFVKVEGDGREMEERCGEWG